MTETEAILRACSGPAVGPVVLATVVRVQGSAYRRPGARMLLLPDGRTVGTVSGGCLEGDVKLRGWRLTDGNTAAVVRYDSTADGEIVWQLGLGCKGIVDVLLERLDASRQPGPLDFLRRWLADRQPGVLARVVAAEGEVGARVGSFLALGEAGTITHDFAAPALAEAILPDATAALHEQQSRYTAYELPGGRAEVFLEAIRPPRPVLVCGAGHDAIPLVRMTKAMGWHVTVFDPRPNYATRDRFAEADEIIVAGPEELLAGTGRRPLRSLAASSPEPADLRARLPLAGGAAVILTHNYHNDLLFLRALLPSPLRYLGMLGPKSRAERLLRDLAVQGVTPTPRQAERLYGPVGLDIGADSPEAVALAVTAEIQAVFSNRSGGPLRDRDSPIHDEPAEYIPVSPAVWNGERNCLVEANR